MTGQGAARALAGVVGSDEQARILLRAGACGPGRRVGGVVVYDEGAVLALAERPWVDEADLRRACPHGFYLGRLARTLSLDLTLPWEQVGAQVRQLPAMPWLTSGLLAARVGLFGRLPWVATLCGLVVHGADLTGFDEPPGGRVAFRLERPGTWFEALEGRWFPTGRGGRPWVIRDPALPPVRSSEPG
jgi:hypothetical protein